MGRGGDGRLVWLFGGSLGRTSNGAMAERAAIGDSHVYDVPDGADPALAAGLGIAGLAGWLPFAWRAPLEGGENVLVLGATGSVGLVAVQVAKLLGAARVVAAGRSAAGLERAARLGADATIRLDEADDLVAAFKDAFGGGGPNYVFDPLWGEPAAAAVQAAVPWARIVNLGQSAGADVGARVRGRAFQEPDDLRTYGLCSRAGRSSRSTTDAWSSTRWRATSSSRSSACRSTPSRTRGAVRPRAPARSSSSCPRAPPPVLRDLCGGSQTAFRSGCSSLCMNEQQPSRIAEAKRRALAAKQKLGVAAAAAFVAVAGLAWASHPGSTSSAASAGSTSSDQSSTDDSSSFEESDDFGGFDSFGSVAPSGGAAPQVQTHVS